MLTEVLLSGLALISSIASGAIKHLITLLEELQVLGVAFVSLAEGVDATTPAGKLQILLGVSRSTLKRWRRQVKG
jgi:DNA invertase Pin-like site-specific DNA recombinase